MSEVEVYDLIRDVLAKEFEISGAHVQPSAEMREELDLDSLDVISLAHEIGAVIDVSLDDEDVRDCKTLADLASSVAARIARDR